MRLGEYRNQLATFVQAGYGHNPAYIVLADGNRVVPDGLCSWRGSYDELTLSHGDRLNITVKELADDANEALSRTFYGYKGGDFTMTDQTPVWADEYGGCNYNAITSMTLTFYHKQVVLIHTVNISEYRW